VTLHLVRLPVDLNALARAADNRGWTTGRRLAFDEGAALHHLLGETFGPAVLQPFRLSVAPKRARGSLYAYTCVDPGELAETAAATAMPEVVDALSPAALEAKPMPTGWRSGQRIGIDVRLRPTVRLAAAIAPGKADGATGNHGFAKGAEIDAFLAEALKHESCDMMEATGRTREAVYRDWLAARFGSVATLEEARLAAFARTVAARGGKGQEAPDIVVHGTIRIDDPVRFAELLSKGVGRHRAYGFGMLLLRPARGIPGS
jgi:CRISPR system Cascade subunit CasE